MPCIGPRGPFDLRSLSSTSAMESASGFISITELIAGPCLSISANRARYFSVIERAVAERVPLEDKLAMLKAATRYLNGYGITSVVNATGNLGEIRLFAALRDRGELTVRTRTSFGSVAVPHHLTAGLLADLEEARRLYHDDWVAANLVKFFADGSTGLIPPLVYTPEAYQELVMEFDRLGYQIMTHAARNDSVHMILDTYERVEQSHGPRDRRLRISRTRRTLRALRRNRSSSSCNRRSAVQSRA